MPPKGKLPDAVIADFEKWIALGAPDPRDDAKPVATAKTISVEEGRKFWAYQPLAAARRSRGQGRRLGRAPTSTASSWPSWRRRACSPAADAEPRRADPPALLRPDRPAADAGGDRRLRAARRRIAATPTEKVVDRLLASPHFGERWGRHWLDVARYAESTGGGRSLLLQGRLALSRLRHRRVQPRQAVRPLHPRADRRRPAARGDARGAHRQLVATAFLVLGPTNFEQQDKDAAGDGRDRRAARHDRPGVPGHDHRLRPLPRPQVRPDPDQGLLRPGRHLQEHARPWSTPTCRKWVEVPLPIVAGARGGAEEARGRRRRAASPAASRPRRKPASASPRRRPRASSPSKDLPGIVVDDAQAKKVGAVDGTRSSPAATSATATSTTTTPSKGEKTLTFVPEIPKAGKYEVRLAYVPGTNRASKVPVTSCTPTARRRSTSTRRTPAHRRPLRLARHASASTRTASGS